MLIPRPKIWTPKWPGEVRRYLHLRRDTSTGHLDKHDNGEDDPDHLAKGDCCCEMCDCCFSGTAIPDGVRCEIRHCSYGDSGCSTPAPVFPSPVLSGHIVINNGNDLDEDDWEGEGDPRGGCWVTKTQHHCLWKQWIGDGSDPCLPAGLVDTIYDDDAWVYLDYHNDGTRCRWRIGFGTDRDAYTGCYRSYAWRAYMDFSDGGSPFDLFGCCGDTVDDVSACTVVGSGASVWEKYTVDSSVTIINNKCCFCGDEDGDCVVAAFDYHIDAECNDDGYHVCSESDPDHDEHCP